MIVGIADTHTTIWYLFSDPRLGRGAATFFEETQAKGDHIGVSAISLAEIVYLSEKGRIPTNALADLLAAIADPKAVPNHTIRSTHSSSATCPFEILPLAASSENHSARSTSGNC